MKYVLCIYSCGYRGCEDEKAIVFSDDTTDAEIDQYFLEGLYDYAIDEESVIGPRVDYEDDEDYEQTLEDYYGDCSYDWHFVEPGTDEFEDYEWEEA